MSGPRASAGELGEALWKAVIDGDEYDAVDVVRGALEDGWQEEDLLLDVVAAVQARIGVEWAADRISVAQEHAATAINERVITALVHHGSGTRPDAVRGRVTVSCVDGEWHAFPRGSSPRRCGCAAGTSTTWAPRRRPRTWSRTSTTPTPTPCCCPGRSPRTCRGRTPRSTPAGPWVCRWWRAAGRSAWTGATRAPWAPTHGPGRAGAAAVLEAGLARPTGVRQAVDDLPHLADQEYSMVTQSRGLLVKETPTELEHRFRRCGVQRRAARAHGRGPGARRRLPGDRPVRRRRRGVHRLPGLDVGRAVRAQRAAAPW